MNSLTKVIVLVVMLYACVSSADEEKKEPRYSSFDCIQYDKDNADNLAMRNCILRDVVLASEKGHPTILFYAREDQDTPLLPADKEAGKGRIVEMAPRMYASVKVVRSAIPENLEPVPSTAVLMSAQGNSLTQFLFDTLFGVYWMLTRTGDIAEKKPLVNDPDGVTIVEVGRSNEYANIVQGSLSTMPPVPLRKLKGVHYSRIVVGPAGHQMTAHVKGTNKYSPVERDLVELYRSFFLKVAMVKDEDYDPLRVIVSHRFTSKKIVNGGELFSGANEIGNCQVAFLSQLPIKSQIELVAGSRVFISTHSEDMVYMLFLRPDSSIIEVMPYGIESDINKKIAELCGLNYHVWQNTDRSRAQFDAKILDTFPLTEEQKKTIIEADKYDPSLPSGALTYWETQDTKVNVEEIKTILTGILPPKDQQEKQEINDPDHEEL